MRFTPISAFIAIIFISIIKFNVYEFSFNLLFFYYVYILLKYRSALSEINKKFIRVILFANIVFLLTLFLSPCQDLYLKGLLSLLTINIIILGNFSLLFQSRNYLYNYNYYEYISILFIIIIIIFSFYAGTLNEKIIGFYLEPSHLALVICPMISFLIFSNKRYVVILGLAFGLYFFNKSSSTTFDLLMPISIICGLLVTFKSRLFKFILLIIFLVVFTYILLNSIQFSARFSDLFSKSSNANLSSMVYSFGLESALNNFKVSFGFGLGFNMMGCMIDGNYYNFFEETLKNAGRILGNGRVVNYNDGSFLFSKILSEFGFFSIHILFLMFLYPIYRIYFIKNRLNIELRFIFLILITNLFGLFIRGTGYFFESFLLVIFTCILFYAKYLNRYEK
jgi:hypothetical protein